MGLDSEERKIIDILANYGYFIKSARNRKYKRRRIAEEGWVQKSRFERRVQQPRRIIDNLLLQQKGILQKDRCSFVDNYGTMHTYQVYRIKKSYAIFKKLIKVYHNSSYEEFFNFFNSDYAKHMMETMPKLRQSMKKLWDIIGGGIPEKILRAYHEPQLHLYAFPELLYHYLIEPKLFKKIMKHIGDLFSFQSYLVPEKNVLANLNPKARDYFIKDVFYLGLCLYSYMNRKFHKDSGLDGLEHSIQSTLSTLLLTVEPYTKTTLKKKAKKKTRKRKKTVKQKKEILQEKKVLPKKSIPFTNVEIPNTKVLKNKKFKTPEEKKALFISETLKRWEHEKRHQKG